MAKNDIQQFVEDLSQNEQLRERAKQEVTTLGAVVDFAKDNGYEFTFADLQQYLRKLRPDIPLKELTPQARDVVATSTNIAQTVEVASTGAVVTNVAAVAEVFVAAAIVVI